MNYTAAERARESACEKEKRLGKKQATHVDMKRVRIDNMKGEMDLQLATDLLLNKNLTRKQVK